MVDLWLVTDIALIPIGFLVLNEGAKFLTDNAAVVASRLGTNRFTVGALLVSTLAALPELLVTALLLKEGSPEIALSNALASNVVTIAFVIGLTAFFAPIRTNREVVLRDAVFLATVVIVAAAVLLDGTLSFFDGLALIALFVPYAVNLAIAQHRASPAALRRALNEFELELEFLGALFSRNIKLRRGVPWLAFGVVWAVVGAEFIAFGAVGLTAKLGVNPWFVGLTVVAIGTSLPDIVGAYHANRRGHTDLSLGMGIGACVVTSLLTLGTMGLIQPTAFEVAPIVPTVGVMVVASVMLLLFLLRGWKISRRGGLALMGSYVAMVALNAIAVVLQ